MRMESPTSARSSEVVYRALQAELTEARRRGVERPSVVDVGGGTGVWAVPLAAAGCQVTVVEPSPNARATLSTRAEEEGVTDALRVVADDVDVLARVVAPGSADLVLAHGLLEVVDDPAAALAAMAHALSPDGAVSVLAANRHAAVLHRALAGRYDEAVGLLNAADGVLATDGDALERRFDVAALTALLDAAGMAPFLVQGDGIVLDTAAEGVDGEPSEFELAAARTAPLRDIATRLHVMARRKA